ncbi:FkbM family methyltransferase [Mycolicibacterium frederiksbergense]|uniref:FkbM family methyltransferase n=1 Tax=Mycolicibacterium frederiksbergense TaxID=117567 RepID=UPI00265C15AD|nr:FkbM family methyltransferase [Mycolicibacterium frederiksbergense]MDO0972826.1 FkbM family methyltransferase [Mycolicibacterium frederiksbergense]
MIDAGANKGQFSLAFRSERPTAQIIAFEPLTGAADTFEAVFAGDDRFRLERCALAASKGSATFHVADRADSSSLLSLGPKQERAFGVRQDTTIEVSVRRLDECVAVSELSRPVMLKVDVQGGELGLFEGLSEIGDIDFIYVELSYIELYVDQPLFHNVTSYLAAHGFRVIGVFNQVFTPEFGPTQADVLFRRAVG